MKLWVEFPNRTPISMIFIYMIKLKDLILDAIIVDPDYIKNQKFDPLKDTDTIRVYHGFNSTDEALDVLRYGLSGKERKSRKHSYEAENNPYGLFITSVLRVAKEFSNEIIIEFTAKLSELQAPVWPGGSYTVQGQLSQYWSGSDIKDKMQKRELGRLKTRAEIIKSTDENTEFIRLSDRPELAKLLLYSREYQALFMGDLDVNRIRNVWINETPDISTNYSTLKRYSRKDALLKYKSKKSASDYPYHTDYSGKLYRPSENWNGMDDFVIRLSKKEGWDLDVLKDMYSDVIKDKRYIDLIADFERRMWPKQVKQATDEMNIDYYSPSEK